MNSGMRKQSSWNFFPWWEMMIWKINPSTRTEDKKEKQASSGGWRVKEGSESTLGCEGSAQRGCEQIWGGRGTQADLERLLLTEGGADAGAPGRCPRGSGQGGRRAEWEWGGEDGDRAGGPWGHSSKRWVRGRLTWSEVYKEIPVLCRNQAVSGEGWGRIQMRTLLE